MEWFSVRYVNSSYPVTLRSLGTGCETASFLHCVWITESTQCGFRLRALYIFGTDLRKLLEDTFKYGFILWMMPQTTWVSCTGTEIAIH